MRGWGFRLSGHARLWMPDAGMHCAVRIGSVSSMVACQRCVERNVSFMLIVHVFFQVPLGWPMHGCGMKSIKGHLTFYAKHHDSTY